MTNEQINIAIAEMCGWTPYLLSDDTRGWVEGQTYAKCPNTDRWMQFPDYCNDLNAMNEAMSAFDYEQAERFVDELRAIVERDERGVENPCPFDFEVINATPRQRAEAFLRTIGKWEDSK